MAFAAKAKDPSCEQAATGTGLLSIFKDAEWTHVTTSTPSDSTEETKKFLAEFLASNGQNLLSALAKHDVVLEASEQSGLVSLNGPVKWVRKSKSKATGDLAKRAREVRLFKLTGVDGLAMEIDIAAGDQGTFVYDIRLGGKEAKDARNVQKNEAQAHHSDNGISFPKHMVGLEHQPAMQTLRFPFQREAARSTSQYFQTQLPHAIGTPAGDGSPLVGQIVEIRILGAYHWLRFTDHLGRQGWIGRVAQSNDPTMVGVAYYDGHPDYPRPVFEDRQMNTGGTRLAAVPVQMPQASVPMPKTKPLRAKPKLEKREHGAVKISAGELEAEMVKYAIGEEQVEGSPLYRFIYAFGEGFRDDTIPEIPHYLERDLKEIEVGREDAGVEPEMVNEDVRPLLGFHTLPNGLTFYGMYTRGDWEAPVFVAVYFDGKDLRAFIPTEGNTFNTAKKSAYGNHERSDAQNARERFPVEMAGYNPKDEDFFERLKLNGEKIKADILAKLQVKP